MLTHALFTDFYQLTMLQSYYSENMNEIAVFEFFVRRLPKERNFLIFTGLQQVLEYSTQLEFTADDLRYLKKQKLFTNEFLNSLKNFKFTGDIYAMPEGSIFFENEPVLQVIAPISQAQFIESRVINILQLQTMIASKAIRSVMHAPGKILMDFGMRRAHGAEAALYASRANYLAGFTGTATVAAGKEFNIPVFGTMAHSYIEAHDSEIKAFSAFSKAMRNNLTILIDTYDTEKATKKVIALAKELQKQNISINAVRIDSGDLIAITKRVRKLLDSANLQDIKIFVTGDLDEYRIKEIISAKAPVDGFGVGTKLDTSSDAPSLDCVYKLQEYANIPKRKKSLKKETWPGRKQVYRSYKKNQIDHDVVTTFNDKVKNAKPLLMPVMKSGKITSHKTLDEIRQQVQNEIATLPDHLKKLDSKKKYNVLISHKLEKLKQKVDKDINKE